MATISSSVRLVAGLLDGDQTRHQVVGGVGTPLLQQLTQVTPQPQGEPRAFLNPLRSTGEGDEGVESLGQQRGTPKNFGSSSIGTPSSRQITATGSG